MSGLPGAPPKPYPTTHSAGIALAAALGACFAGSTGPTQSAPLLLESAGLASFAGGVVLRRRGRRLAGRAITVVGFLVAVSTLVGAVALSPPLPTLLALLSCGLGAMSLTLGVFPVHVRWARTLAVVGVALVFVGVVANAVVGDPPIWRSAVAVTATFPSWDAAERAIVLGKGVGADAETASVELAGTATSALVALAALVLTVAVSRLPIGGRSLFGLALLLVAAMAFILALSHFPRISERGG